MRAYTTFIPAGARLQAAARRTAGAAGLAALSLIASCTTATEVLEVKDPDIVNPTDVQSVAGANAVRLGALAAVVLMASGCNPTVKVEAPDKPIEINLNVRIEQEVRVKIDRELDQVFDKNPELFGLPKEKKL